MNVTFGVGSCIRGGSGRLRLNKNPSRAPKEGGTSGLDPGRELERTNTDGLGVRAAPPWPLAGPTHLHVVFRVRS